MKRKQRKRQLERLVSIITRAVEGEISPVNAAVKYLISIEGERVNKVRPQFLRYQVIQMKKLGLPPEDIAAVLDIPVYTVFRLQR